MRIKLFRLILFSCIPFGLYATETNLDTRHIVRDVIYARIAGEDLKLDVASRSHDKLHPVALLIHGGGWSSGDKAGSNHLGDGADISPWFEPLSKAGFVWFSINYRLAPKYRWPACYEDVKTALLWIKVHAKEYGGDSQRITVIGHSAGGHLAFLLGTDKDPSLKVESVVGCAPVTDFEYELLIRKQIGLSLQNLHHISKEITPEAHAILKATAPINFVHAGMSPFLIIHGVADKTVPIQESVNFQHKVILAGGVCDLIEIPNAPHRLISYAEYDPQWTSKMISWILEHHLIKP
jgi:acetyl esterase/lipase